MRDELDTSTFVVLGGSLAAGMGHFGLSEAGQRWSFPAQMATRLGTTCEQPLLQSPGLGSVAGLPPQPPVIPDLLQSTVRRDFPVAEPALGNLSVPGLTLAAAHSARPMPPLVHRRDTQQTLLNFILGLPHLQSSSAPGPTQLEYALGRRPTLVVVELGFQEALEAALAGEPRLLPAAESFRCDYARLLERLRVGGATVVATTIPDPFDTAYFSDLETAAGILKTEVPFLRAQFGLAAGSRIALPALVDMGYQLMNREIRPSELDAGHILTRGAARGVGAGVERLNEVLGAAAQEAGALVYDLHGLYGRLAREGVEVGGRKLTAGYLGGLFLLNGLYPGPTGHAVIAEEILALLDRELGSNFAGVDLAAVAAQDGNTLSRLAPGPASTTEFLVPRTASEMPPLPPLDPLPRETPIQTTYPGLQPGKEGCSPAPGIPAAGLSLPELEKPLELPEDLVQTLSINPEGSYFGDALRVVDCPDDRPLFEGFPTFGLCGDLLFGGPVLTSSHLHGELELRFSEPDEDNVTRFEIRHPGGLMGEDAELAAPQLFRMRSQLTVIQDIPGLVSRGELNLNTGAVTNFHYNLRNINTSLMILFGVNPGLPPVGLLFPGPPNAGSTWARFEQRPDGKLDVTLAAHMFVPLGAEAGGEPIRFALPFATPNLRSASFPARGTSLHPHIHVTTKELPPPAAGAAPPDLPFNTVRELVPFSHNTSFGDLFGLDVPELGGPAMGRSHLLGRLRVQFGPRCGNTVPVLLSALPPGGLLSDDPENPPYLPPGVSRGMIGFDEVLEFPSERYPQKHLASADDPFNLTVGNFDLRSGRVVGELLFRGFVLQELFTHLLAVEPCTPSDSFNYQGPASFEREASGQTVFRFNGEVFLPYPRGFRFPSPEPEERPPFVVAGTSRLDPFRRIQAMDTSLRFSGSLEGGADRVVSSTGREFSYRFSFPCERAVPPSFEYTDHGAGGTFRLVSLTWMGLTLARGAAAPAEAPQILTFSGFGTWSGDGGGSLHQVSVQISLAPAAPYVGIAVDGGRTSNVNTKPATLEETLP